MPPPATCPHCGRANASHRLACLYCGGAMPNPTAPPPPRAEPEDLDRLVREALRGGSVERVKRVLGQAPAARDPVSASPDPWQELEPATTRAVAAWRRGERAVAEAALHNLERLVRASRTVLEGSGRPHSGPTPAASERAPIPAGPGPPAPQPPSTPGGRGPGVRLPPVRFAAMLVMEGVEDQQRGGEIAEALSIDPATARALATPRHPVVASRGDDLSTLEARAERLLACGIAARVVTRGELLELPLARPVLALDLEGACRVGHGSPWLAEDDLLTTGPGEDGEAIPGGGVHVIVIGEVASRIGREAADGGRWLRQRNAPANAGAERRRAVLDLHGPAGLLRIVEGMTDLRAFGAGEGGTRQAWRRLLEALPQRFEGARIEARRVCAATTSHPESPLALSGWPTWEEHTRLCLRLRAP